MKEIIKLENVIKMYPGGRRAVNGISLSVYEGKHVAISGPPGSGKSTMMRLISGLEKPSDGKITVLDRPVEKMDTDMASVFRSRHFGIVLQNSGLMERLTVLENTALPLALRGIPAGKRFTAAKEQLKAMGLDAIIKAYPKQISVYEKQLVSIARALAAKPEILMIDEIDTGLSQKETESITGIINTLSRFGDFTLLNFCRSGYGFIADRHYRLEYGTIQEDIS